MEAFIPHLFEKQGRGEALVLFRDPTGYAGYVFFQFQYGQWGIDLAVFLIKIDR